MFVMPDIEQDKMLTDA